MNGPFTFSSREKPREFPGIRGQSEWWIFSPHMFHTRTVLPRIFLSPVMENLTGFFSRKFIKLKWKAYSLRKNLMVVVKERVDFGALSTYLALPSVMRKRTTIWRLKNHLFLLQLEVTEYRITINFNQLFSISVPRSLCRTTQSVSGDCLFCFCHFIDKNAKVILGNWNTSDKWCLFITWSLKKVFLTICTRTDTSSWLVF